MVKNTGEIKSLLTHIDKINVNLTGKLGLPWYVRASGMPVLIMINLLSCEKAQKV